MSHESEAEKRRREEFAREHDVHERDPTPLDPETQPYDPDTGAVGTTRPRTVEAAGSAGPTGVVPPTTDRTGMTQWKRPAAIAGIVLLIIVVLLLLT